MKSIGRREMLRGFGSIAIGLPLLEAMGCKTSASGGGGGVAARGVGTSAQGLTANAAAANYFLGCYFCNGTNVTDWYATAGPNGTAVLSKIMQPFISDPSDTVNGAIDLTSDLLCFRGVDNRAASAAYSQGTDGHAEIIGCFLNGTGLVPQTPGTTTQTVFNNHVVAGGHTIDQQLGQLLGTRGLPSRTLNVNIGDGSQYGQLSYTDVGITTSLQIYASGLFQQLFVGNSNLSAAQAAYLASHRKSVLDGVMADYQAVAARASASDVQRIQQHLTSIRELELRIAAVASCSPPSAVPGSLSFSANAQMLADLMVLGFKCNLAQVGTFCFGNEGAGSRSPYDYSFLQLKDSDAGADNLPHAISHNNPAVLEAPYASIPDEWTAMNVWYASITARMMRQMKTTILPDGNSMLDEAVVVFGSGAGQTHTPVDIAFMMGGKGGGINPGGRLLDYSANPIPHNRALMSVLRAFGDQTSTSFGNATLCADGPLDLS